MTFIKLICLAFPVALAGCNGPQKRETKYCSGYVARVAAVHELEPVIRKIVSPETREEGCYALDEILKDKAEIYHYEDKKPLNCDWSYDRGPYKQVISI